ncbi:DMT family transporter [Flavobacterium pallidum]|uniref:Permease n=1 Tax=Flavobacterium pallidum TaxID=2172098 RepID=A0A2S1SES5_9FLAO|nr:DMT family transporter [Flavobacterium pallidum]AWI24865.1 permease [Flavobacterium pallidum]
MKPTNTKWIFLFILALIWGSSFILILKGLDGLTPIQLGALRIAFAGVFTLLIGFRKLSQIPRNQWKIIALTGLLGNFFPAFLFAMGETKINSSVSAVLNSLTPLNTLMLGLLVFGFHYHKRQILGVFVGFLGSCLLVFCGNAEHGESNYSYAILLVVATMCYGTNVNLVKKYLSNLNPLTIAAGNFAVMIVPAFLILGFTGFFDIIHQAEVSKAAVYVMILGVMGTGVSNILFYRLIQISSPVFATSVTYLIPIVAFFWGFLNDERLTMVQILGGLVILAGVYLSSKK